MRIGPDDLAKASLAVFKVAVTWPLEPRGIEEFVRDKKRVLVLDPKRRFLEPQIRDLLFNMKKRPSIIGKKDEMGQAFLSETRQLEAMDGAHALRHLLGQKAKGNLANALDNFLARQQPANTENIFPARIPHFCSGCPHNTGTKILPGARVGAGIGCHAMVQLQEGKSTEGYTQMGGEGMTVIGAAPFRKKSYVWVNEPEIINGNSNSEVQSNNEPVSDETGMVVNAPLAGNIFRIEKNVGDTVSDDETIIVLEAMKMETTIKTPACGKIKQIFIKNGDKVQSGDPLFEVV